MSQGLKIISGLAIFELLYQRIYGNLEGQARPPRKEESPDYKDVFEAVPFTMLENLRSGAARAFSPHSETLEYRGVFTGRDDDGVIRPVFYRLDDLREAVVKTIDVISPKSGDNLMADFDAATKTVWNKQLNDVSLNGVDFHILRGWGRGVAPVSAPELAGTPRRSYRPEMT